MYRFSRFIKAYATWSTLLIYGHCVNRCVELNVDIVLLYDGGGSIYTVFTAVEM